MKADAAQIIFYAFLEKGRAKKASSKYGSQTRKPGQSKKLHVKARLAKFLVLVRLAGEIYDTLSLQQQGLLSEGKEEAK